MIKQVSLHALNRPVYRADIAVMEMGAHVKGPGKITDMTGQRLNVYQETRDAAAEKPGSGHHKTGPDFTQLKLFQCQLLAVQIDFIAKRHMHERGYGKGMGTIPAKIDVLLMPRRMDGRAGAISRHAAVKNRLWLS
jgi:hypothetical protein